jgi:hypothetical protein
VFISTFEGTNRMRGLFERLSARAFSARDSASFRENRSRGEGPQGKRKRSEPARLVGGLRHPRRRVDQDDVAGFFRGARLGPERIRVGGFHFLDTKREHPIALGRPRREAVLRVGIQYNDTPAHGGEFGCQVPHDRGFPNAAFSSRNRDDRHGEYFSWKTRLSLISGNNGPEHFR